MEFKDLAKEWNRMCDRYSSLECETKCEIHKNIENEMQGCEIWIMKNPEKAEEIISAWAKEHPVRTYLSDLLEKYPNLKLREGGTPKFCPTAIGFERSKYCDFVSWKYCEDCWNQEVQE